MCSVGVQLREKVCPNRRETLQREHMHLRGPLLHHTVAHHQAVLCGAGSIATRSCCANVVATLLMKVRMYLPQNGQLRTTVKRTTAESWLEFPAWHLRPKSTIWKILCICMANAISHSLANCFPHVLNTPILKSRHFLSQQCAAFAKSGSRVLVSMPHNASHRYIMAWLVCLESDVGMQAQLRFLSFNPVCSCGESADNFVCAT